MQFGKSTFAIPKAPLVCLIKEKMSELHAEWRIAKGGVKAFRTAAEAYLEECFALANILAKHRHGRTLAHRDLQLAHIIKGEGMQLRDVRGLCVDGCCDVSSKEYHKV